MDPIVIENVFSSAIAGFVSRLIFHPIDTCKARIQANVKGISYNSFSSAFFGTIKDSGYKGIYRGLNVALLGGVPGTCMYYTGYEAFKISLIESYEISPNIAYLASGILAEAFCCIVYVPIDVIKERLQVFQIEQKANSPTPHSSTTYTGTLDALKKIYEKEGIRGFYKGYFSTVLSFGPYSAIYFSCFEKFKNVGTKQNLPVPFVWNLTSAAIAAGLASFITTPLDLIKLRIQISDTNTIRPGFFYTSFRSTFQKEGMKGLFKGATARVLYYTPTQALAMAIFEELKSNNF